MVWLSAGGDLQEIIARKERRVRLCLYEHHEARQKEA
jgi:hypothetical protein